MTDQLLVAALVAFASSVIMTHLVTHFALHRSLLDVPNTRSSHVVAVPRMGGVAIVLATMIGWVLSPWRSDSWFVIIGVSGLLLAGTGLLDDLRSVPAINKYAAQLVASATAVVLLRPTMEVELPFIRFAIGGVPAIILAVVWITALVNAFNFMDGIDGITGGVGLLTGLSLAQLVGGEAMSALIPLIVSLAGFLVWNFQPASIFMGDVGSQFVGFMLAVAPMLGDRHSVEAVPMVLIFSPYLFDTGLTIIRRLRAREDVFSAHRSHLYQRLTRSGLSHRAVANLYYVAVALSVVGAIFYRSAGSEIRLGILASSVAVLTAYAVLVHRRELSYGRGVQDLSGIAGSRPQARRVTTR